MSTQNPSAAFDLRCYVREEMLDYLQKEYPAALPKVRSEVTATIDNGKFEAPTMATRQ